MTVEPFVCRIVKTGGGDAGADSGSGIIAKFEPEFWDYLQTQPSCLGEKYDLSVLHSRSFYVLLTAHRNVYEESEERDKPLAGYVDNYTLELDTAVKIPLHECIFPAVRGGCIAVSCCGVDSILVLCDPGDNLTYTLKAHRNSKCCIMSDFLLLFLDAEKVKTRLGSDSGSPPTFCKPVAPQPTDSECCMYWRTAAGTVEKCNVRLQTSKAAYSDSSQEKSLKHNVEIFHQQRSLSLPEGVGKEPCCIGAPISCSTPDGGVRIVGINTGGAVTTLYGVFNLLKGGLVPFMAAVDPNHSKTRTLMPSRWKKHVTQFISHDTLPNLSSVLDLLQCLLHSEHCVPILKFSPRGGAVRSEIVSGLEVYTAIFRHYGTLVKQGQNNPGEQSMACSEPIVDEMVEVTKHFAGNDQPPEDIIVALFECLEAMQSFEGIAQSVLKKTRGYLDEISMKSNIDSNATVNKCFKHIDVLARQRGQEPESSGASSHHGQATNGNGYNLC